MRGGDLAIRQARDTTTQGRSHTVAIAVTTNNDEKGAWSGSIFLFPLSFLPVPLRGVRLGGTKSLGLTGKGLPFIEMLFFRARWGVGTGTSSFVCRVDRA